eukprot:1643216-Amphidinium_carterae.1
MSLDRCSMLHTGHKFKIPHEDGHHKRIGYVVHDPVSHSPFKSHDTIVSFQLLSGAKLGSEEWRSLGSKKDHSQPDERCCYKVGLTSSHA